MDNDKPHDNTRDRDAVTAVSETSTPIHEVCTLYAAADELRSFTGTVSPDVLRLMLSRAGLDDQWLTGPRWDVLKDLWRRGATADQVSAALIERGC